MHSAPRSPISFYASYKLAIFWMTAPPFNSSINPSSPISVLNKFSFTRPVYFEKLKCLAPSFPKTFYQSLSVCMLGKFSVQAIASIPVSVIPHQQASNFSRFGKVLAFDRAIIPRFPILFPDIFKARKLYRYSQSTNIFIPSRVILFAEISNDHKFFSTSAF